MSELNPATSFEALLLPIPDAAKALGIGRTTTYSLIKAGELPTVSIRGRRLVPMSGLRDYVARLEGEVPE